MKQKRDPMAVAMLIVLTFFFLLFGFAFNRAHAADFMVKSVLRGNFDAITWGEDVDSVKFYLLGGWAGGNIDSAEEFSMLPIQPEGFAGGGLDSLARFCIVSQADLSPNYNPAGYVIWYMKDGRQIPDDNPKIVSNGINVSVALSDSQIQEIITAINVGAGGTGDYPETLVVLDTAQDALVVGARTFVFQVDTVCCQNGSGGQYADLNGRTIYSLDIGTFPVAVSAHGYFQDGAYQLVTQAAPGGTDTVKVFSFIPSLPVGGPDSSNVIIFTDVPYARAKIVMHGLGQGTENKPVRDTAGTWLNPVEIEPNPKADANGVIQVRLVRSKATSPKCGYDIDIFNAKGKLMVHVPNYAIPDSTTHTLKLP